MRRLVSPGVLVPLLVVSLAGGPRIWRLGWPPGTYADESWYVQDADAYLGGAIPLTTLDHPPPVRIAGEVTWVHPPLGKWLIALGAGPLPDSPAGWRLPSAFAGSATVLFVYLTALTLWGSVWWAGFASLMLALDGEQLVMSRLAMLDGFVAMFVAAACYCLALDHSRVGGEHGGGAGRIQAMFGSKPRLAAGLLLGAGVAVKWAALPALGLAGAFCLTGSLGGRGEPFARRIKNALASFVLVPGAVYVAAYGQFWAEHGIAIRSFLLLQWRMLLFNLERKVASPSASSPATWPLLTKPVRLFPPSVVGVGAGEPRILLLGNPVLWWAFLASVPVLLWVLIRRRTWPEALIVGMYAVLYLPWFAFSRTEYLWYMTPTVPLMALGVVAAMRSFPPRAAVPAAISVAGLQAVAATAFLPLWLGTGAPWLDSLFWLRSWRA